MPLRQVVYSVATSLDGYIAGPRGEADWIVMDPDIDFDSIFARFDVILMGRKTYQATRSSRGDGSMPGMDSYVFSRTLRQAHCRGVTVSDNPSRTIAALNDQPGKDIWQLFGGGVLCRTLLERGLVDRVSVAVIPVVAGSRNRIEERGRAMASHLFAVYGLAPTRSVESTIPAPTSSEGWDMSGSRSRPTSGPTTDNAAAL